MLLNNDFINHSRYLTICGQLMLCLLIMIGYAHLHNQTTHYLLLARFCSLLLIALLIWGTLALFSVTSFQFDVSFVVLFLLIGSDTYEFYYRYYEQKIEQLSHRSRRLIVLISSSLFLSFLISAFFQVSIVAQLTLFLFIIYFILLNFWVLRAAKYKK